MPDVYVCPSCGARRTPPGDVVPAQLVCKECKKAFPTAGNGAADVAAREEAKAAETAKREAARAEKARRAKDEAFARAAPSIAPVDPLEDLRGSTRYASGRTVLQVILLGGILCGVFLLVLAVRAQLSANGLAATGCFTFGLGAIFQAVLVYTLGMAILDGADVLVRQHSAR